MKNINQIIGGLAPARRAKIEGRARQLIGEEMAFRQLRKARRLTQVQIARALNMGQDSVSKLENRSDFLLSTLRSYIEAMGGRLNITAEFKEGTAVLFDLSSMQVLETPKKPARRAAVRRKRHLELLHAK
jgi:transcriptional regulator with XRE-family HTH domain